MEVREIIEGITDESGEQLHVWDTVVYENETYNILKQKDDPAYIMHPIGGNPRTTDIDVTTVNAQVKRLDA